MQYLLVATEQVEPDVEDCFTGFGESVHAAGGPGFGCIPEGGDEPGAFELAECAVHSRGVEAGETGFAQLLDELVAIGVPAAEIGQEAGAE